MDMRRWFRRPFFVFHVRDGDSLDKDDGRADTKKLT